MDTITFEHQGKTFETPIVNAFGLDGKPTELIGDIEPQDCDHAGACWSSDLDMRCPRCGSRLFLPPRCLARRDTETVEAMYAAWVRAGWPHFMNSEARWSGIHGPHWTLINHPLFAQVGGLAVRNDHLNDFSGE